MTANPEAEKSVSIGLIVGGCLIFLIIALVFGCLLFSMAGARMAVPVAPGPPILVQKAQPANNAIIALEDEQEISVLTQKRRTMLEVWEQQLTRPEGAKDPTKVIAKIRDMIETMTLQDQQWNELEVIFEELRSIGTELKADKLDASLAKIETILKRASTTPDDEF